MNEPARGLSEMSIGELRQRLRDPRLLVVDVLPWESYAAGHIPGAINLPLEELPVRAGAVLPDYTAEIAVYCAKET